MATQRTHRTALDRLLDDPRVRRAHVDGVVIFEAASLMSALVDDRVPEQAWAELKQLEPSIARLVDRVPFDTKEPAREALDLRGVLRVVQTIRSPKTIRIQRWLADAAIQRIDEAQNPELAFLRAQKLYRRRGYSRRWIDRRLRAVSTRQELVSEWSRRGARESEHFRELTNELMRQAFGRDVNEYRRFKGLVRATDSLRYHMTDLELALVALTETTAITLSRDRNSGTLQQLRDDVRDAGSIVARTRGEIERSSGHPVLSGAHAPGASHPAQAA
jgi:hypothetical protein